MIGPTFHKLVNHGIAQLDWLMSVVGKIEASIVCLTSSHCGDCMSVSDMVNIA